MFKSKSKDFIEEKLEKDKKIHEKLVNSKLGELNKLLTNQKDIFESYIVNTSLEDKYHDLLNSKDTMNSEYQKKYNQAYHAIDVELYKLNKKVDSRVKKMNYDVDHKKDKLFKDILY